MPASVHRFYLEQPLPAGEEVTLPPDRSHQIARVLRLRPGDEVVLFNGDDFEVPALIERVDRRATVVSLGQPRPGRQVPMPGISLAQGLLKGEKFDWVVQKATELGAARIIPLMTERTVVSLPVDRAGERRERWRRIAVEAAEQSGRTMVPEVAPPTTLPRLTEAMASTPTIVCWEGERRCSLAEALPREGEALLLVVGPEGGLTRDEAASAREAGAALVSLGPLILRAETAAVAALAGIATLAAARRMGQSETDEG